jgi:hypothetical protein
MKSDPYLQRDFTVIYCTYGRIGPAANGASGPTHCLLRGGLPGGPEMDLDFAFAKIG